MNRKLDDLQIGCIIRNDEWTTVRVLVERLEPAGLGGFAHQYVEGVYVRQDGKPDKRRIYRFASHVGPNWHVERQINKRTIQESKTVGGEG